MKLRILPYIEDKLKQYKKDHHGETPLYIIVPAGDGKTLLEEVKAKDNHANDIVVTTYQGSKIVTHENLKPGEVQLTNELPETSS